MKTTRDVIELYKIIKTTDELLRYNNNIAIRFLTREFGQQRKLTTENPDMEINKEKCKDNLQKSKNLRAKCLKFFFF